MSAAIRPSGLTAFLAPIGMISQGKNPRRDLGDLEDLTASIRRHGVLLPPLVERNPAVVCDSSLASGASWPRVPPSSPSSRSSFAER